MEDAGKITAKTNADETSCDLGVKRKLTILLDYLIFVDIFFNKFYQDIYDQKYFPIFR